MRIFVKSYKSSRPLNWKYFITVPCFDYYIEKTVFPKVQMFDLSRASCKIRYGYVRHGYVRHGYVGQGYVGHDYDGHSYAGRTIDTGQTYLLSHKQHSV